ncbi:MAG: peptidase M15 [Pseudonocardiaceae bacterium]|nr:peptidase M15 [Pseudonocardiaceae bacterium]
MAGGDHVGWLAILHSVPHASRRGITVLITVLLALLPGSLVVPPALAAPGCANREVPPPPVDTSEEPKPGQPSPKPLPVPDDPVGGERMAECGTVLPAGAPPSPEPLTPHSWLLTDLDSGAVLAAHNPHARHRPASLIKVLTALVVIDELDPKATVRATQEDANQEGTSTGLFPNNTYTVGQLLRALLMSSGNDVAHALARQLGGAPRVVEKMNAMAGKLGAKDTRAATPSGLDGPGMSSSAYDLALLMRAAMVKPEFADAVHTQSMKFPGRPGEPSYEVYNDNKLLGGYAGFLGGKTGFTDDARHTYAGAAKRGGHRIAVTLLRGEQQPIRVSDQAALLLDYGFTLAGMNREPVGRLVEPAKPKPQHVHRAKDDAAAGAQPAGTGSSFGSVGGPLVALVAIGLALGGLLWLRRKAKDVRNE